MLTIGQQLAVGILISMWLIFTGVYASVDVTCEDRRELSLLFAIFLSPFAGASLYYYITVPCLLTGIVFGMLMTDLIYMIARWLLPCKEEYW
jgi:pheromone shutdown protein TraB